MGHDDFAERRPFFRSTIGLALVGFIVVGAFHLIAEHRRISSRAIGFCGCCPSDASRCISSMVGMAAIADMVTTPRIAIRTDMNRRIAEENSNAP